MRHQSLDIDPVGARHDDEAGREFVVGLVAEVLDHGQFLGVELRGDLLHDPAARDLIGQRRDDDIAALDLVTGALFHAASTGQVELQQIRRRGDDLAGGRKIGSRNEADQILHRRLGMFEQMPAGARHLAQIVRQDVGRHADRDPGGAVEQQIRQARGQ